MKSPQRTARIAGALYLAVLIFAILGGLRFSLIKPGDISSTIANIQANQLLFRLGAVSDLIHVTSFLLLAWSLYVVFKPVNKELSLLFVFIVLASVAVQSVNLLINYSAMQTLIQPTTTTTFELPQLQAQADFFQSLFDNGTLIAQVFFGLWLFPLGYVVSKSGYVPKILGTLLMIGSVGYLLDVLVFFIFPQYRIISTPGLIIATISELSLTFWLLFKGINTNSKALKSA